MSAHWKIVMSIHCKVSLRARRKPRKKDRVRSDSGSGGDPHERFCGLNYDRLTESREISPLQVRGEGAMDLDLPLKSCWKNKDPLIHLMWIALLDPHWKKRRPDLANWIGNSQENSWSQHPKSG